MPWVYPEAKEPLLCRLTRLAPGGPQSMVDTIRDYCHLGEEAVSFCTPLTPGILWDVYLSNNHLKDGLLVFMSPL